MRYKKFGNTGLDISVIGLGAWGMGGVNWGACDDGSSIDAIHRMLEHGVNLVDTAPVYGFGHSEEVVAKALKGVDRDQVYISTKVGTTWTGGATSRVEQNLTYDSIIRQMDDSLKRLQLDYVDFYIIHWPDTDHCAPVEETMRALERLKSEGKTRFLGASNHSIEQTEKLMEYDSIDVIQPPYCMVDRKQERLMQWASSKGIATMTYGSLGAGILTGAIREMPNFAEKDLRKDFYDFYHEPKFSKTMELLKTLDIVAEKHDCPVSQVAINWSTQSPIVSTALMGVRSIAHADENCKALEWTLSDEEIAMINAAIEEAGF